MRPALSRSLGKTASGSRKRTTTSARAPRTKRFVSSMYEHVAKMLKLLGSSEPQAASEAAAIMKLETALAKVSLDVTSQRDPHNVYHMMPIKDLQALTPVFNWEHFYPASGSPQFAEINVAEPEFFQGMNQVIRETDLSTIQAYLRWQLVLSIAGSILPKALDEEKFDFGGRKLTGIPEQETRWKRCVSSTDGALPEALGKAYVEQQFPAASKEKALRDDSRHRGRDGSGY